MIEFQPHHHTPTPHRPSHHPAQPHQPKQPARPHQPSRARTPNHPAQPKHVRQVHKQPHPSHSSAGRQAITTDAWLDEWVATTLPGGLPS